MKRILAALALALAAATSFGATLYPLSLLSPTGSTSGQFVVSTGPTTAPVWSTVSLATLGGIVPVLNGGTGVTTAAAELARIGAGATASPLSQFAATTSAQFAGVISDETGTGLVVLGTAPTLNQPNIVGVTAATNASAGSVGESPTPTNLSGVSLTNATTANVASISLGPGIWFVQASAQVVPTGTTVISNVVVGVSTTSATQGALGSFTAAATGAPAGFSQTPASPWVRVPLGSTTTVFAIVNASFSVSTCTANGFISALRVH